jgi:hypothetical protein
MTAIDTAMLSAMRSAIGELLPDTGYILTGTITPDSEGGVTTSWGTTGTTTCRVDISNKRELLSGGAIQPFTRTILSVPYDTTITNANRFVHGAVTYAVVTPSNNDQSWIAVKRLELEAL